MINKIHNENCLETMKRMDDCFIDLTITSPPYDNLREYNGFSFDFENVANQLYTKTKDGGILVWNVADATIDGSETGTSFKQALFFMDCGFKLHDTMIYQKTGTPFPSKVRYNQTFEYMFVFSKGKPQTFNPIMKKNVTAGDFRNTRKFRQKNGNLSKAKQSFGINEYGIENNIWKINNGMFKSTNDKIAFEHPAIFPEELVKKHIYSWSKKGDLIYDPFMGSGTTAKMAHLQNRNWIGSEISKEYTELANKRIEKYINQTTLF